VDGRRRDPGLAARLDVLVLAREASERVSCGGVGDDHEPVSLAEAAARCAADGRDDALDGLAGDRVRR
jgi:hypothetical protein